MSELADLRAYLFAALAATGCAPHHTGGGCSPDLRCAPAAQVQPYATGSAAEQLGCPSEVADNRNCTRGSDGEQTCAVDTPTPADWPRVADMQIDPEATKSHRASDATTCCYEEPVFCPGRPLMIDGRATVASTTIPAERWVRDALAEHASIASFARAALELMAVGAPLDLLADVARAMADEVEHARLCSELAGHPIAFGPLPAAPPREPDLARLAVDTFVEGCVGETTAALAAARELATCSDPDVARVLRKIADDEARHAALAWRTLAWAIATGGEPVRAAVRTAAQCGPDTDAWRDIISPMVRALC